MSTLQILVGPAMLGAIVITGLVLIRLLFGSAR